MSLDSEITWQSLLAQKREQCPSEAARRILTEIEFHDAFIQLCEKNREFNHIRLQNNLQRQIRKVVTFSADIDSANTLSPPDNLSGILWTYVYAVVQAVFGERKPLSAFLKDFKKLNDAFPTLGPKLSSFPYHRDVQKTLQHLFFKYIEYCEMIISPHFATAPGSLDFGSVFSQYDTASAILQNAKTEWEEALGRAEKERLELTLPAQIPNGNSDDSSMHGQTNVHFKDLKWLGTGGYGHVVQSKELGTGQLYARKVVRIENNSRSKITMENHVRNEVQIMQKLRHYHIASVSFWHKDIDSFSIFMLPVADYDLRTFLENECTQKNFPPNTLKIIDSWFGCLVTALSFAHTASVKHEDLKPSNILIKNDMPYLADFGSAKDFSALEMSTMEDYQWAGTPVYYAPESRPWGRKADIFALGCVFSEMISVRLGRSLRDFRNFRRTPDIDDGYAFRKSLPKVHEWLEALDNRNPPEHLALVIQQIRCMLAVEVDRRPDARTIKKRFRTEEILFCTSCE